MTFLLWGIMFSDPGEKASRVRENAYLLCLADYQFHYSLVVSQCLEQLQQVDYQHLNQKSQFNRNCTWEMYNEMKLQNLRKLVLALLKGCEQGL